MNIEENGLNCLVGDREAGELDSADSVGSVIHAERNVERTILRGRSRRVNNTIVRRGDSRLRDALDLAESADAEASTARGNRETHRLAHVAEQDKADSETVAITDGDASSGFIIEVARVTTGTDNSHGIYIVLGAALGISSCAQD